MSAPESVRPCAECAPYARGLEVLHQERVASLEAEIIRLRGLGRTVAPKDTRFDGDHPEARYGFTRLELMARRVAGIDSGEAPNER